MCRWRAASVVPLQVSQQIRLPILRQLHKARTEAGDTRPKNAKMVLSFPTTGDRTRAPLGAVSHLWGGKI